MASVEIVGNGVGGRVLTPVAGGEALVARLRDRGGVPDRLDHDLVLQRARIGIGFEEPDRRRHADPELRGQILGRARGRRSGRNADATTAVPAGRGR